MFSVDFGVGKVSRGGSPDCGLEKNSNSISLPLSSRLSADYSITLCRGRNSPLRTYSSFLSLIFFRKKVQILLNNLQRIIDLDKSRCNINFSCSFLEESVSGIDLPIIYLIYIYFIYKYV